MSYPLWKAYREDNVDKFRKILLGGGLKKKDLNGRDDAGLTLLHRTVADSNGHDFAVALIEHPLTDLYVQDRENGWTALHRALYFGNVSLARLILEKEKPGAKTPLTKIKDNEGNIPYDVYNSTVALKVEEESIEVDFSDQDSEYEERMMLRSQVLLHEEGLGDEFFAFGSNKNLTLGFGDEDNRQYPERVYLERPEKLVERLTKEYRTSLANVERLFLPDDVPSVIKHKPIVIEDSRLAKLSSAVLTTDPECNLYMCGYGPGGRLGTGDEQTRFSYVPVDIGKRVDSVALGQNHTLAVTSDGEVFSWGTNTWNVLGYGLPRVGDLEPVNPTPRQIFGPLKKEVVIGVAASAIHSVAFTSSALYTWGKNEGQLGLMDSDSRSLEVQTTPRRVAASLFNSPIESVSAINKATVVLLANHTVCVFTAYGYNIAKFQLHLGFRSATRYVDSHIAKVTSGGDTIAAVSSRGDLFAMTVNTQDKGSEGSTTNPQKIKSALTPPEKIWSLRKGNWDGVRDVAVGENGSIILCTRGGALWKRKRSGWDRLPLTNVVAVRDNAFGGYAAVRREQKVDVKVDEGQLREDVAGLFVLEGMLDGAVGFPPEFEKEIMEKLLNVDADEFDMEVEWTDSANPVDKVSSTIQSALSTLESAPSLFGGPVTPSPVATPKVATSIPAHSFVFCRSTAMREAFQRQALMLEGIELSHDDGKWRLKLDCDFLTALNLVYYLYTDRLLDVWQWRSPGPRFRQVRLELMRSSKALSLHGLEEAARLQIRPTYRMDVDFAGAWGFGDTVIELDGGEVTVHSALMKQRSPFFAGLFAGRHDWMASKNHVDLSNVEPETFEYILRYLYCDVGAFDEEFETVMDVMMVADELMLDRLVQICQEMVGRAVNTRNVCELLEEIPFGRFRDAALEYCCLQLETLLENRLLADVDGLDDVVKKNQAARMPFKAEDIFERYPELAAEIDEERQRKLRDMTFREKLKAQEERRGSTREDTPRRVSDGGRALARDERRPSTRDERRPSTRDEQTLSKPKSTPSGPTRKTSNEMMFEMDDVKGKGKAKEDNMEHPSPSLAPWMRTDASPSPRPTAKRPADALPSPSPNQPSPLAQRFRQPLPARPHDQWPSPSQGPSASPLPGNGFPSPPSSSWTPLSAPKVDKAIFSPGISSSPRPLHIASMPPLTSTKLSQKERKKLAAQQAAEAEKVEKGGAPWHGVTRSKPVKLADVKTAAAPTPAPAPAAKPVPTARASSAADTRFAGQKRSVGPGTLPTQPFPRGPVSTKIQTVPHPQPQPQPTTIPSIPTRTPSAPHHTFSPSPVHATSATSTSSLSAIIAAERAQKLAEASLQLSIKEIIAQQKREQEIIAEAKAKRSLAEIQAEQEFLEWWEGEERRVREEEDSRAGPVAKDRDAQGAKDRKGGRQGRGKGKGGKEEGRGKDGGKGEGGDGGDKPGRGGRTRGEGLSSRGGGSGANRGRGSGGRKDGKKVEG
jgi:alpha-tubulin suppressor-like RCC1 family protein